MSILSTLALVATAIAIRKPEPQRIEELEAQLENLQARLDVALEDAHRQWEENQRLRALEVIDQRLQQMANAVMQQQYAAMQAQAAQSFYAGNPFQQTQNQMLGMQNIGFDHFCNCVPARHDMFLRGQ
jgi:methylphosphotriester-DNA--protein-cysteine methyltransferase